jgi:hypothetical protein
MASNSPTWRDKRITLQIERALADVRLPQGCNVEVVVYDGSVLLIAQLGRLSELDAILGALKCVPGMRNIGMDVTVAGPIFVPTRQSRNRHERGFDKPFGVG